VSGAVTRFRAMAFVVGIALFVLLLAMLLKYGFEREQFSETWSPIHGFLYIVYLVTVADLSRRVGWSLLRTVGVMLAGTVPVLSFVVERRTVRSLHAEQAGAR
jgi:integral membrane protein